MDGSEGKSNKIWVDEGSKFYNNLFRKFFKEINIEMYSTYNEGRSVVAEKFIKNLKNKIFKHMTAVSKNVWFDVLGDIVDDCNNTFHRIIGMKPIDVKSDFFADYNVSSNENDPKFKVGDHVRISKHKNFFAKGYSPNLSEQNFVVKKKNKNIVL